MNIGLIVLHLQRIHTLISTHYEEKRTHYIIIITAVCAV